MSTTGNGDNLLTALVSGSTAAAVTATVTYPLDFMKTQQQLNNHALMTKWQVPSNFPSSLAQLSRGCSALVLGSVIKNSTRLIAYNWSCKFMAIESHSSHGVSKTKTSAPRIVIAGLMSAFIETLWLVPFENIKISMVQNQSLFNEITRSPNSDFTGSGVAGKHHKAHSSVFSKQYVSPHAYYTNEVLNQYKAGKHYSKFQPPRPHDPLDALKIHYNKHPSLTFLGTVKEIYTLKGLGGFTAGTFITFGRQIAISTVWFSTYNATRQFIDPHNTEQGWFGHNHTAIQSMGLHILSSIAVIGVTQPLDVIKSHIQSKNGKTIYKDSLSTAYRLFLEQGPRCLFKGALPRSIKVLVSGGLTAAVYEYVEKLVQVAGGQALFTE
ncbi:mitochondrial tricarboxylate/dicarboxylate carrier protein [Scheffersomyces amazonensis]|uniref:mitochondrial tricarboxylate/dicarboxylate carrier protein n=1 Tax=Scheffersomyces amazonensis TaxID=1078765 RepID=UPI00315D8E8F